MLKIQFNKRYLLFFVFFIVVLPFLSYGAKGVTPSDNKKIEESYYLTNKTISVSDPSKNKQSSSQKPVELTPANKEKIELKYKFSGPKIKKVDEEYYSIEIMNTLTFFDEPGLPILPVKTAKILIPEGRSVKSIAVIPGKKITLEGEFKIEYGKQQIPISRPDLMVETEPDSDIYTSSAPFPGKFYSEVSTQFFKGYKILIVNLYPLQYVPTLGEISYYPDIKLKVITSPSGPTYARKAPCRNLPKDVSQVKRLIDNPSIINSYTEETFGIGEIDLTEGTAATSSLSPGDYEYVIITTAALESTFQVLADHKYFSKGLTSAVVTVEWIYSEYDGTRPDGGVDNQTRIRNFINDAYTNWGTNYVLLGGDGDGDGGAVIPHRGVYGEVPQDGDPITDTDIPCDLYFVALDGSWDNDGDGVYGEDNDGEGGGDVDLLAEVYIGRIPCDTTAEAINQISKIIAYEQSTPGNKALLIGEQMDDYPTYGGDCKDEVYHYFPSGSWTRQSLYQRDGTFSATAVINAMNSSQYHVINHQGHANNTYNMGLNNSQVDALSNTIYFFAYSQGCYCNAFDNRSTTAGSYLIDDAISEHFTAENNRAAFAYIGNSRYGWYAPGSTNGPSQLFDIEFFDAVFNENIKNAGRALQDSKEDLIGLASIGAKRWCYFSLNLMGDPETSITWLEPDLTLTGTEDIYFSDSTPSVGETITISAEIHNDGIGYSGTELLMSQTSDSGSGYPVYNGLSMAQSFLVGPQDITVSKIALSLWKVSSIGPNPNVNIEIQTDGGGFPSGAVVPDSTSNSNTINSSKWYDFTFSTPPVLSGNTIYWIVAKSSSSFQSAWLIDSGNPYADGALMGNPGSSWISVSGDATFKIFDMNRLATVEFYDGDPDYVANLIGINYLQPIPAGESDIAAVQWIPATSGSYNIWVVVDPDDVIQEADETNNKDYNSLTVMTEVSVSVSPDYWSLGIVEANSVTTMTPLEKITVTNEGTETATFTLQVTDSGGSWFAATTENGNTLANTFVMGGVFASLITPIDLIVAGDFNQGTDDDVIISASPRAASTTIFCSSSSSADGANVPESGQRALWLQFKSPPSTTTYVQQAIVITVGAQAVP